MEIKVTYKDGRIESHAIPGIVGVETSQSYRDGMKEECMSDIDDITDVIERFSRDAKGFHLERYIVNGGVITSANWTRGYTIVPASDIPDVARILVDGEQVYPELQIEGAQGRISAMERALDEALR